MTIPNKMVSVGNAEDTSAEHENTSQNAQKQSTHWLVLGLNEPTETTQTLHCLTVYLYKFTAKVLYQTNGYFQIYRANTSGKGLGEEEGF